MIAVKLRHSIEEISLDGESYYLEHVTRGIEARPALTACGKPAALKRPNFTKWEESRSHAITPGLYQGATSVAPN